MTSSVQLLLFGLLAISGLHFGSAKGPQNHVPVVESAVLSADVQADAPAKAAAPAVPANLKCYQCNSYNDAGCDRNNTLKEKYLLPCAPMNGQNAIGCWKLSQKVEYDQNSELPAHERVVRKCAYIGQDAPCANRAGFGGSTNQCFCNATKCNGITGMHSNPIITGLSALVVLLLAKVYLV